MPIFLNSFFPILKGYIKGDRRAKALVLVECKSRLSKDDNEGIDRYAAKQGLFVIKPSGETVAIANEADFQAATW